MEAMDKKKVIGLIKKAETFLYNSKKEGLDYLYDLLTDIEYEVLKPDWISVDDELPPYVEEVFVISKKGYKYVSCRRFINKKNFNSNLTDKNDFILNYEQFSDEITHWRKIDKLEV